MKRLVSVLMLAILLVPASTQQLARGKRLFLKDGSYHIVTEWKQQGERVRYFSAERGEWEELPSSLVDWEKTRAWERGERPQQQDRGLVTQDMERILAEEAADRAAEEAKTPEVAPGLKLPVTGGVWLLDRYNRQPQLVEVVQNGSQINKQMGRNILRAALNPFAFGSKQTIELKGARARVQSHAVVPTFFVNLDPDTDVPDPAHSPAKEEKQEPAPRLQDRFRIVRAGIKGDKRVVGNLKIAITGRVKEERAAVPTLVEPFAGKWVKVTSGVQLEPGEYALVEMLGEKQMNLYVWDFGVNPSAPQNPSAWKPQQPPPNPTGTKQSPGLTTRPKN